MSMKKAKHPIKYGVQVYGAYLFALWAHRGQKRKYTFDPYIVHPVEVMQIVATVPHTKDMLMAALLHDVVEDCGVQNSTIRAVFGHGVADLVHWLTDPPKAHTAGMNRAARKAQDCARLARAPADAQTIKLADLISNTVSITEYDPDFSVVYLREKAELLKVLTRGDAGLHRQAQTVMGDT